MDEISRIRTWNGSLSVRGVPASECVGRIAHLAYPNRNRSRFMSSRRIGASLSADPAAICRECEPRHTRTG